MYSFNRFETNTTFKAHVRLKTHMVIKKKTTKRNKEINDKQNKNKIKKKQNKRKQTTLTLHI